MNDSIDYAETASEIVKAPKTTESTFSLWELLTSGGVLGNIIMIILFILFLIAIYIFVERMISINKSSHSNSDLVNHIRDFVYDGKIEAAIELCKRTNTPEARMIQKGILRIGRPINEISAAIENTGELEVYQLEKNLNVLATISGAAPMLGFLGTVVGMIMAFYQISIATQVTPNTLASGIYTAMATTAVGLIVGIAAYMFYNILISKVEKSVYQLQSSVTDFLDLINKPIVK